jgi:hypothetical protein
MVKKCAHFNIGLGKIATDDGGFLVQLIFTIAVISAGIILHLNMLQWTLVTLISFVFLITGIYRNAAHVLTRVDLSISMGQAVRIRAMSNLMLTLTAGITFFTYLMIFMPKINQLL